MNRGKSEFPVQWNVWEFLRGFVCLFVLMPLNQQHNKGIRVIREMVDSNYHGEI